MIPGYRTKNLTGKQFGLWKILAYAGISKHGHSSWKCQCGCGYIGIREGLQFTSGKSLSCGCIKTGISFDKRIHRARHGMHGTGAHRVWNDLLDRCFNPKNSSYKHYGERGIFVCEKISLTPKSIVELIGHRPKFNRPRHYSIDRIDNDGHYSCGKCKQCKENGWPMNIRWSIQHDQTRNTRRNRILTINGQSKTMIEWAESSGVSIQTISNRRTSGRKGEDLISVIPLKRRMK